MVKTAAVLSGGGVKGVGHLAFLEAMKSQFGGPDIISGSSAGAITGALYAAGCSREIIIDFYQHNPLARLNYLSRTKPGFFDSKKFISLFKELIPETFEELNIPLIITATNLLTGETEYFSKGDLLRPLVASCAVPMIFSPVNINHIWYVDGGATDNFPIQPFLGSDYEIYGSYVSNPMIKTKEELNSTIKVASHSNAILIHQCNKHKFELFKKLVDFPLNEFTLFDTKSVQLIYGKCRDVMNKIEFE